MMIRPGAGLIVLFLISTSSLAANWNVQKDVNNSFDFSKPISYYLRILKEGDKEVVRQFKENAEIINEELHFTLSSDSYQNKYDKEEVVNATRRNQSQRSELRYTLSNPQNNSVKMSFRFRTPNAYLSEHRVLLSQIKTLTTPKFRQFSHPNVAIYAENGGMVSCVHWYDDGPKRKRYDKRSIQIGAGYLTDGNWHHVTMEFIPNSDVTEGLCRVTVDGIVQIESKGHRNVPYGLRKDKYHLNIGPYRDKVTEREVFIYDDWKVETKRLQK